MKRRGQSGSRTLTIALLLLLISGSVAGAYYIYSFGSDPFRSLQVLEIKNLFDSPSSLMGNTYKVEGTIEEQMKISRGGRIFSIEAKDGSTQQFIPILVPSTMNKVQIYKGQKYLFKVKVDEQGVLYVQEMTKA
ncbi:MAG: hypothetical protein ACAI35_05505 [Candidatus Methylacidiphilales bacterium]|nr:hypothetical protein [Candidatus Methylacidiphilales bacterium]